MICGYKKKMNAKLLNIILATSPENVAEKEWIQNISEFIIDRHVSEHGESWPEALLQITFVYASWRL